MSSSRSHIVTQFVRVFVCSSLSFSFSVHGVKGTKQQSRGVSMVFLRGFNAVYFFQAVSRKFGGCFKEVSGKFHGCFKRVSREFQLRFMVVASSFKGGLRVFERSLKGVSGKY